MRFQVNQCSTSGSLSAFVDESTSLWSDIDSDRQGKSCQKGAKEIPWIEEMSTKDDLLT